MYTQDFSSYKVDAKVRIPYLYLESLRYQDIDKYLGMKNVNKIEINFDKERIEDEKGVEEEEIDEGISKILGTQIYTR